MFLCDRAPLTGLLFLTLNQQQISSPYSDATICDKNRQVDELSSTIEYPWKKTPTPFSTFLSYEGKNINFDRLVVKKIIPPVREL